MRTFKNLVLGLAALVGLAMISPLASANIIYSICTSGCGGTSGSYAATGSAPQAAGLTFPTPISFSAGNLSGPVYTDPSGVIITAWNGVNNPGSASVNGNGLLNGNSGTNTGFEIQLPANTFAFSFNFQSPSFITGALAVNSTDLNGSNYSVNGTSGYVSIISDTALTNLFFGVAGGTGGPITLNDFQPGTSGGTGGDGGGGDPGTTPEPSTFLLLGSGLSAMVWVRRRRRPRTTPLQTRL